MAGWATRTLAFEGTSVAICPGFANPEPWLEMLSLLLSTGLLLLFSGMVLLRVHAHLREASVSDLQTWQLQQIVPRSGAAAGQRGDAAEADGLGVTRTRPFGRAAWDRCMVFGRYNHFGAKRPSTRSYSSSLSQAFASA
jgi:hypothetical protein